MIAVQNLPFSVSLDVYKSILKAEKAEWEVACEALAQRLGDELRAAKSAGLTCGEVLLPRDLLPKVAHKILRESAMEPCGLRGCTLDIQLETEEGKVKIGSVSWDSQTSSTFLLSLTLCQDKTPKWGLSHLLKTLTKGRTLVVGNHFKLHKTRLYRSLANAH